MHELRKTEALIDGVWCALDRRFAVTNPATQDVIAQVSDCGVAETEQAIDAAQRAWPAWSALSSLARSDVLWRWYELVVANQSALAQLLTQEQGKPLAEALGEVLYGASYIRWFAEEARRLDGDVLSLPQSDRRGLVIRQSLGVVAAITPWNFPIAMFARKVAPALAAGCTVVLKPAAETPLSALAVAELALRAGVPKGVFNVVTGTDAPAIGQAMTSHPAVKKLTFTGSTKVGRLLLRQCADAIKRTSMELGGNAPLLVFEDADVDLAVAGTMAAKFRNAGQTCICANRILVHEAIYPRFLQAFTRAVDALQQGAGEQEGVTIGPMISAAAVQTTHERVAEAVTQGAIVHRGGFVSPLGESFYPPTLLLHVQPSMRVWREELFAPVLPIMTFTTDEQAIALANDTEAGLAAYVFTESRHRCWQVSEALQFGMVGVNETAISSEVIPFGGIKASGSGREGSKYGLADYTELKYICMGGLS